MKSRCAALLSVLLLAGSSALAQSTDVSGSTSPTEVAAAASTPGGASAGGSDGSASLGAPAQKSAAKASSATDGGSAAYSPIAATTGTLGLFTLETGDLLPKRGWSFSGYGNRFTRMPGSVVVTDIGLNFGYGFGDRWSVYADFQPWTHTHIGLPSELSLDSPSNIGLGQFGSTIYRQLGFPLGPGQVNPAYVEDYPFAANNDGGVSAVTLGVKFGVWSQAKGAPVSLSLRNDFMIPTVRALSPLLDNGTQTGQFDDQISLALSHTWGSALTLTGDAGYTFTRDPRADGAVLMQQADQAHVGAGFIAFPGHRVEVMAEYTGLIFVGAATLNTSFGARDPIDSVTGVRLYPIRNVAIDLGYRYMLNLKDAVDRNGFVIKVGVASTPTKQIPANHSPVTACTLDGSPVFAGSNDAVNIHTTATDPDGDPLTYSWSASGGRVDGTGPQVRWLPAAATPGSYTVTVTVDDGRGGSTTCSVNPQVQQRPNRPPTVSLSGDKTSVFAGERVHYTATASDPDGDRLNYTWRANGGNVSAANASADLDTTGLAPGNYTVTVRVEDGRGGAADASAGVEVKTPPPPPQASKVNDCDFKRANSARLDNVCKRVLDDVALRLQNDARATLVIIGYADPKERRPDALASMRAGNAVQYLASKGVDRARITTRTGAGQAGAGQQNRRIDLIWVPEGATY